MKQKNKTLWLIVLAAALLVTLLVWAGSLRRVDKWVQDRLFQRPGLISEDIVLIGIDEESLSALGPYNSWDRTVMASALEALAADPEKRPAVTAVDALYASATDPAADARLAEAVKELGNVVTGVVAEFGQRITWDGIRVDTVDTSAVLNVEYPYDALREAATLGHINAMYDQDGVMRHALLCFDTEDGGRIWSMPAETARLFLEQRGESLSFPQTTETGQFYIPYTAGPGGYSDGVSLVSLIRGEVPADYYAGKIVLIGPYAVALQDAYFTPMDTAKQMYGVELQANIIQAMLEENYKQELPDLPQLLLLFVLCAAAFFLFLRLRVRISGLLCAAGIAASLFGSILLYRAGSVTHPLWLPAGLLALYVASLVYHYARARRERLEITHTFERYVAPEIVQEILRQGPENLQLGGKLCQIAVLFVDIRGFTTMSEHMSPEEVVRIINRYLAMTSDCVERNRGTLDKFIGDATMAFWGAPLPEKDAAYLACKTGLEMIEGAKAISDSLRDEIGGELRVGVGVNFGMAVVGNMGSERHLSYTAIGDTVNTASRLESNAPGNTVYISRSVADALGDRARVSSLGSSIHLKGKTEGFEVLTLDALDQP